MRNCPKMAATPGWSTRPLAKYAVTSAPSSYSTPPPRSTAGMVELSAVLHPLADVDEKLLVDEDATQKRPEGLAHRFSLRWRAEQARRRSRAPRGRAARAGEHRAFRLAGPDELARGGRADLRPPAQPLRTGGRDPLHPQCSGRARRRGAGRGAYLGDGFRDRATDALLPGSHRPERRGTEPRLRHRERVPLRGHDEPVLVGDHRRPGRGGYRLVVRLPDAAAAPDHRGWSRSTTRRSTSSSTGSGGSGRRRTSRESADPPGQRQGEGAARTAAGRRAAPGRMRRTSRARPVGRPGRARPGHRIR